MSMADYGNSLFEICSKEVEVDESKVALAAIYLPQHHPQKALNGLFQLFSHRFSRFYNVAFIITSNSLYADTPSKVSPATFQIQPLAFLFEYSPTSTFNSQGSRGVFPGQMGSSIRKNAWDILTCLNHLKLLPSKWRSSISNQGSFTPSLRVSPDALRKNWFCPTLSVISEGWNMNGMWIKSVTLRLSFLFTTTVWYNVAPRDFGHEKKSQTESLT